MQIPVVPVTSITPIDSILLSSPHLQPLPPIPPCIGIPTASSIDPAQTVTLSAAIVAIDAHLAPTDGTTLLLLQDSVSPFGGAVAALKGTAVGPYVESRGVLPPVGAHVLLSGTLSEGTSLGLSPGSLTLIDPSMVVLMSYGPGGRTVPPMPLSSVSLLALADGRWAGQCDDATACCDGRQAYQGVRVAIPEAVIVVTMSEGGLEADVMERDEDKWRPVARAHLSEVSLERVRLAAEGGMTVGEWSTQFCWDGGMGVG